MTLFTIHLNSSILNVYKKQPKIVYKKQDIAYFKLLTKVYTLLSNLCKTLQKVHLLF